MNLLMLSGDSSPAQGRETTFSEMLRHFSAHWSRIDVISPRAPGATPRTIHGNVYLHPSPRSKIWQSWYIRQQGRALFRERDYALVVSHDFGVFYNGLGAWWLTRGTGVPYVSELHHVEGYPRAVSRREQVYRALANVYIRWMWPRAAAIRAVNAVEIPGLLRQLGVPDEKVLVLPSLYLDYDIFRPMPDQTKDVDLLFVGRLTANKGVFSILDALVQVKRTHPDVTLSMLGSGPLWMDVERYIAEHDLAGNVTLISRLENAADVAALYNRARMLICASTAEGGPRVTVEAMACGTPVISTPVGVMAELIQDGVNGLLWRWQVDELVGKMRLLLDDDSLRERIAEEGRQSVGHFQADTLIDRYAQAYHDLIARQKGAR